MNRDFHPCKTLLHIQQKFVVPGLRSQFASKFWRLSLPRNRPNRRQVLDCASPRALLDHSLANEKRRRAAALQDAGARLRFVSTLVILCLLMTGCANAPRSQIQRPANSFPADALITQRGVLAVLGRQFTLNGYLAMSAAGGKRHGERVEVADIAEVTHDPLIAQLRYRLRRQHGAPTGGRRIGVTAVFSRENVRLPEACNAPQALDGSLSCHGYGSSVAVTATFGLCAAGWVLDQLAEMVQKNTL